ncbi:MAG: ThuA domain-containing protein [Pseudoruegeria sp.]
MSKKSALIVWGGWEGHTPEQSATVIFDILQEQGFDVIVAASTSAFADPNLNRFDLIVPIITMGSIKAEELKNLLAAVRAGTGLAGFHGTMCDTFRNEPDYQFMTGGQWVQHPGDIMDYTVQITAINDPITAGLTDFPYCSEQYYMHIDPSIEILATTTFSGDHFAEIEGVVMPVVWKRHYGKGRVFYSALGHAAEEFKVPQMKTLFERGADWAAK